MTQDSRSRLEVWHEARVKAGASCSTTGRRESIMHHMGEPLLLGSGHCKNTRNPLFRLPPERPLGGFPDPSIYWTLVQVRLRKFRYRVASKPVASSTWMACTRTPS